MKSNWTLEKLSILMFLLLIVPLSKAEEFSGHISGFMGLKTMDSKEWPNLDSHFSMGVVFDITKDSWPVSIVLDITDTGDKHKQDGMENLGHTTELHLGIRKILIKQDSRIQPYVGGGISSIYAEQEFEVNNVPTEEDDNTVGIWLGAGMYYDMNPKFVLGLDVRYSDGEVTLFDEDLNAGGSIRASLADINSDEYLLRRSDSMLSSPKSYNFTDVRRNRLEMNHIDHT